MYLPLKLLRGGEPAISPWSGFACDDVTRSARAQENLHVAVLPLSVSPHRCALQKDGGLQIFNKIGAGCTTQI